MSLDYGILGFLSAKNLSGYDIKKLFDISAAYFWPADQAQIYRSLKKLEDSGHVNVSAVERVAGPSKKLYEITDSGREALRAWLLSTQQSDFSTHSSFMLQFFFSGTLSKEEQLEFLDTQLVINRGILKQLRDELINNKKDFVGTLGYSRNSSNYKTSEYTYKWQTFHVQAYSMFLESLKEDILTDDDNVVLNEWELIN
jgi:DNA-binding PadR family transcriptional regulator